jgi:L-amino acid N-acyltransferase
VSGFKIEVATPSDLNWITDIYNDAILNLTATFDTVPKSLVEQQEWFDKHGSSHPLLVARGLGWASLSAYSDRCAYSSSAEVSVYVAENSRGKGVGDALMKELIVRAKKIGLHTLISRIADKNPPSIALHLRHGFVLAGTLREVGVKFGRKLDVDFYQLIL